MYSARERDYGCGCDLVGPSGSSRTRRVTPGTAVLSALALVAPASAEPPVPPSRADLQIVQSRVAPTRAFFGGRTVRIEFRFAAGGPLDLQVEIVRQATNKVARRYALPLAIPQQPQRVDWDGLTGAGRVARNGRYRVRISAPGGSARYAGALTLRGHMYPIRGAHADRGPIGAFGVGRSGGRRHNGFDVNAGCGTPLVAARAGRVRRRAYDPVLYGNYIIIRGRLEQRDYWYVHLQRPAPVGVGQQVSTGQRIGRVGETGNARTIGCHLHFELRVRGRPIDPRPELHAWDGWG